MTWINKLACRKIVPYGKKQFPCFEKKKCLNDIYSASAGWHPPPLIFAHFNFKYSTECLEIACVETMMFGRDLSFVHHPIAKDIHTHIHLIRKNNEYLLQDYNLKKSSCHIQLQSVTPTILVTDKNLPPMYVSIHKSKGSPRWIFIFYVYDIHTKLEVSISQAGIADLQTSVVIVQYIIKIIPG